MADKVIRLTNIHGIRQTTSQGKVVLIACGKAGGKDVRVEMHLDSYDAGSVVNQVRASVDSHISVWNSAKAVVGDIA